MKDGITHILAKVSVYDEWFDEGADCVLIPIDCLDIAKSYRKHMEIIRRDSLDPAKVSTYYKPLWIDEMPQVTSEFAEKILVIDPNNLIELSDDSSYIANNEEEIEEIIGDVCVEIEMLNVWDSTLSVTCYAKHTEIEMGATIYDSQIENAPTLAEVLNKEEPA